MFVGGAYFCILHKSKRIDATEPSMYVCTVVILVYLAKCLVNSGDTFNMCFYVSVLFLEVASTFY